VQFHWDREGQRNDHSSCWLRVASSWAGNRYGAVVIPRVNMEVLVTFLEGDPDQPVISGCLYHRENEVPYALPANRTRTTFKTLSSPGGGGYNELRLEDRKGMEQIFIHAERNFDLDIGHDQRIHVGNERHDKVEGNSYSEFKAEEHRTTHGARKIEVKGDDHLNVSQTQHIRLGTAQLVQAGKEIHLKAGEKIVIDAGLEITLQAGGNFLKVDCGGLTASQLILPGGAPGAGSAAAILAPMLPLPTVKDMVGNLLVKGPMNAPLEQGGTAVGGVASVSAVGLPLQSQSQSQSREPGGLLVASE
jgi:type VI secretion system secreted protein VgrG